MSNSWTSRRAAAFGAAVACLVAGFAVGVSAQTATFECPEGMGYEFSYTEPSFGGDAGEGWGASIKRGSGTSAVGAPRLSVRRGTMRCQYPLPNGAFVLLTRPFPEGVECEIRQDGYFDPPWFGCE